MKHLIVAASLACCFSFAVTTFAAEPNARPPKDPRSAIYAVLKRLEDEGMVARVEETPARYAPLPPSDLLGVRYQRGAFRRGNAAGVRQMRRRAGAAHRRQR